MFAIKKRPKSVTAPKHQLFTKSLSMSDPGCHRDIQKVDGKNLIIRIQYNTVTNEFSRLHKNVEVLRSTKRAVIG